MGEVYKMIPVTSNVKLLIDREKQKREIERGNKPITYSELLKDKFSAKTITKPNS